MQCLLNEVKLTSTRQISKGEINYNNDDFNDKFFDANDYNTININNILLDSLRPFTTSLTP